MFFGKRKLKAENKKLNEQIEVMEEQIRRLVVDMDSASIAAENAESHNTFMQGKLDGINNYIANMKRSMNAAMLQLEQVDQDIDRINNEIRKKKHG